MIKNKVSKPPKQNDELLKGAFKDNFPDFLRFLYPEADEIFDFSRGIEFMDKELHKIMPNRDRKKGNRVADLLTKVYRNDGTEKWILVHTEIEGGNQEDFAFRLYQYNYRLLDHYNVMVETIAIFTGDENQYKPCECRLQGIDSGTHFWYKTYHILDNSQEELLAMHNIFALVVLACQKALHEGKVPDTELGDDRLTIAKALLKHNYDHDHIIRFLVFLKNFLYVNNVEINRIFDEQLIQLSGGTINMGVIEVVEKQKLQQGIQQGVQLGIQQKSAEVVDGLIVKPGLTDEEIADIARVTVDFVRERRAELGK